MCETAIIDEVTSIPWTIVAEDRDGNEVPGKEAEVEKVKDFFFNPNTNPGESWETLVRMMLPDLLELNSGVMVKTFNMFGEFVELVSRDGSAFTKNPDLFGMYTNRADLILSKTILTSGEAGAVAANAALNFGATPFFQGYILDGDARDQAAYFQYGFNTASRPVPFGKREIVWFEKKVRTDNVYGRSAMGILAQTVQTLIYAVEHNLEFFSDNSIPPGVLGLEGMSTGDLKAFAEQWINSQKKKDKLGNWKKAFHKLTMVNKKPTFERLGFTNQELQIIEQQKWWAKLVWAAFGLTATELGFTEDAKGSANQIVQSSIAKKRIIYPILRLIEYYVNTMIIPEFGFEGIKYKYKIFDVDEETKKWELYKLQTESDLKTINEVRNTEGLDPVEWGDKNSGERSPNQGITQNIGDLRQRDSDKINNDNQATRDKMTNKPKKSSVPDTDKGTDKSTDKKNVETKPADTQTSLNLGPFEEPDDLRKKINELLDKNKEKIINILESQKSEDPLVKIKGIDDVPGMIDEIFGVFTIKAISDRIIKTEFDDGWNYSEKRIDKNVPYNKKALKFLQEHTFDNIQSMTEEIANDLKAELSRGIINGEGITKLKERVESVFNVGENRAEMIARTETNRAENNGRLLAMKGSRLEYNKKWDTHFDDRTSPICNRLDNQVVGMNENFKDSVSGWEGQSPPSHVNCRSSIVFIEKKSKEAEIKEREKLEEELVDKKIDIKLKEKDFEIKERKENLLKRLEGDSYGGN